MDAPKRKDGERLLDYIGRAMSDRAFKEAVPCHEQRLVMVLNASKKEQR